MKKLFTLLGILALSGSAMAQGKFSVQADDLKDGYLHNDQVLSISYGFGCAGNNQSPAISWKNPPKGTKSYVVNIYDMDAPTGIGWTHWNVVNIPADTHKLAANIGRDGSGLPEGALQTRTDFGEPGFGGACPPKGETHRYVISVTALKIDKLPNVNADSMPALVGFLTHANALGKASVTLKYKR